MAKAMANILVVATAIIMVMKVIGATSHALTWSVPEASGYPSWAASQTFVVGDTIVFNFSPPHTVSEVTKEGYDQCTPGDKVYNDGPTTITLAKPGLHYFICTFGTHCSSGQKLAINVTNGAAAKSPSSLAPPLPLASITVYVSLIAFVIALLY